MRVLAADDGHHARGQNLQLEGLEVVVRPDEVDLGGQLVGRVGLKEVGVGEDAELAGLDKGGQAILGGLELLGGVLAVAQGRRCW